MVVLTLTIAPAQSNYMEQGQKQPLVVKEATQKVVIGDIEVSRSRGDTGEHVQELIVESTSYAPTGQKTFSNTWPVEGRTIAVDNQKIKIGSRVYIYELNNWYLAEDLIPASSVKKGAIIDIFQNDIGDCWQWGRRDVQIKVIPPQNQTPKNN